MQLVSISVILVFALVLRGGAMKQYCSEDTRLVTEHVTTTYEETRPVQGCVSTERNSQNGYQVVVIRTNTTSSDVLLTLTDISAEGVLIVLDSPIAIKWRLSFFGHDENKDHWLSKPTVVHAAGSKVAESNLDITLLKSDYETMRLSPEMSDEKFGTIVRQHYGGITIMAEVTGANRVTLSLSKKAEHRVPSMCNLNNLGAITDFIVAFNVRKQPTYGCFHPEMIGTMPTDVHIIDLQASALSNNLASSDSVLPVVFFSMAPKKQNRGTSEAEAVQQHQQSRNLTVILKSARPVRWYLESWRMNGLLRVISNNGPVENHSVPSGQNLQIERNHLPDDFQQLWRKVIGETGVAPVSYIKVEDANVISLALPPPIRHRSSNIFTTAQQKIKSNSNFVPDRESLHDEAPVLGRNDQMVPKRVPNVAQMSNKIKQLEQDLEVLVNKKCEQSATIITLPIDALMKFNVTSLSLNEVSCQATKNKTHWVLETLSTSCGSLNSFKGSNPIMMNEIHIEFAAYSEFFNQAVRIPFTCKYPPGLFGFPVDESDDGDDDYVEEEFDDDFSNESEMYAMKILRKRKPPQRPEILVSNPNDEATVSLGDRLKVQTEFASRSFLSLSIEQCWVSDNPSSDKRSIGDDKWLIYEACPINKNVTMFPTKMGNNPVFVFEVTEEHRRMGQIYLFCIMGLCSPIESLTTGNLGLCEDPTTKCSSDDWHIGSAAQQLSRRGPLYVTDRRLNVEIDTANFSGLTGLTEAPENQHSSESPVLHSAHVVMVGVPAEIAVAISIASFLIGAALTGMLCFIHHRKALPKSARHTSAGENREMESMPPSSPSNLAPLLREQQQQQQPSGPIKDQRC